MSLLVAHMEQSGMWENCCILGNCPRFRYAPSRLLAAFQRLPENLFMTTYILVSYPRFRYDVSHEDALNHYQDI
jgi:hypothetical protein